jgi:hypothetical protein
MCGISTLFCSKKKYKRLIQHLKSLRLTKFDISPLLYQNIG